MITQSSPAAVNNGASIHAYTEAQMQDTDSNPDGVSTADLALERDCVDLENLAQNHLLQSIGDCENLSMHIMAICSIDVAMEALAQRRKQAETKVSALSFAAELFGVA